MTKILGNFKGTIVLYIVGVKVFTQQEKDSSVSSDPKRLITCI